MQIVFCNRDKKPVYECNVCSKQGLWSNRWQCIEYGIGSGNRGYEKYFITCSKECRKKDEEEQICFNQRKQLHKAWWKHNWEYLDALDRSVKPMLDKIFEENKT